MTETEKQMQEVLRSVEDRISELKQVKQSLLKCQRDFECASMECETLRRSNDRLLRMVKELAESNCLRCGEAVRKGSAIACCNCKWVDIKNWKPD